MSLRPHTVVAVRRFDRFLVRILRPKLELRDLVVDQRADLGRCFLTSQSSVSMIGLITLKWEVTWEDTTVKSKGTPHQAVRTKHDGRILMVSIIFFNDVWPNHPGAADDPHKASQLLLHHIALNLAENLRLFVWNTNYHHQHQYRQTKCHVSIIFFFRRILVLCISGE